MLYTKRFFHSGALGLCMAVVLFTACKKEDNPKTPEKQPTIKLATSATLGMYLTDTLGNTLYYFSNDYMGTPSCSGGCAALWPVYYAGAGLVQSSLGEGLDLADFGEATSTGGQKQTTYKGWPLYYYAPAAGGTNVRESPGQTTGEGVNNIWFVAKPDYSIMLVNAQLVGHDGKNYTSAYVEGTGKTLYFSDAKGLTLYAFINDRFNTNKFTKSDFSNNAVWPIYETDKIVVPSTLDKTLFGSITVFGKNQLTYKGWPIYYFGQDAGVRGANKGISFPAPGIWPVLTKNMETAAQP